MTPSAAVLATTEEAEAHGDRRRNLRPGCRVEVRTRFDGSWARGFEIDSVKVGGVVIRRVSDGSVIPGFFPAEDLHLVG